MTALRTPLARAVAAGLAAIALAVAGAAWAHGPTIRVSYSGVRPSVLRIPAGTTVHFQNTNGSDGACTLVGDDGAFESPTLARGEGWHYTFEEPGTFHFVVREYTSASGTVVVGPAEE